MSLTSRARSYATRRLEQRMEAEVVLRRPATQQLNSANIMEVTPGGTVYQGKARIWQVNPGPSVFLGEAEPLETRQTKVSLPASATMPRVDDVLEVTACAYDTDLEGRTGVVTSVDGGGQLRASRTFNVKGLFESRSWQPS